MLSFGIERLHLDGVYVYSFSVSSANIVLDDSSIKYGQVAHAESIVRMIEAHIVLVMHKAPAPSTRFCVNQIADNGKVAHLWRVRTIELQDFQLGSIGSLVGKSSVP